MKARDGEAAMRRPLRGKGLLVFEDAPAIHLGVEDVVGSPEDEMVFLGVWVQRNRAAMQHFPAAIDGGFQRDILIPDKP